MNPVKSARRTAAGSLMGALALVLATVGLAVATTAPATANSRIMAFSSDTYEMKVQLFVNKRRARHGLGHLTLEPCTEAAAERWAEKLATSHEFFHQSMTSLLERCSAYYAGETLGKGVISPHRLVKLWMQSPPHRKVLLSRHAKQIGVGSYVDSSGAWVTAANFTKF